MTKKIDERVRSIEKKTYLLFLRFKHVLRSILFVGHRMRLRILSNYEFNRCCSVPESEPFIQVAPSSGGTDLEPLDATVRSGESSDAM